MLSHTVVLCVTLYEITESLLSPPPLPYHSTTKSLSAHTLSIHCFCRVSVRIRPPPPFFSFSDVHTSTPCPPFPFPLFFTVTLDHPLLFYRLNLSSTPPPSTSLHSFITIAFTQYHHHHHHHHLIFICFEGVIDFTLHYTLCTIHQLDILALSFRAALFHPFYNLSLPLIFRITSSSSSSSSAAAAMLLLCSFFRYRVLLFTN